MGLNSTPSSERTHIGFFGRMNAGKSSLINAVLGQEISVVSSVAGTTSDPVKKAMELLPLGPVVIIDTPGLDDSGELGEKRVNQALKMLEICDIAVLAVDGAVGDFEEDLIKSFKEKNIDYIIAYTKSDIVKYGDLKENEIAVSSKTGENILELKDMLSRLKKVPEKSIISDKLQKGDTVILVTPIDSSAPKGRLILPQQQTIRDILDSGCICITVQPDELEKALEICKNPCMVITDSQVFGRVKDIVPENVPLTSFSIIFARYKGILETAAKGAVSVSKLKNGDKVLICEGCTHHRQCEDIGTVKLPAWIRKFTGKDVEFEFTSGQEFPQNLNDYRLIVHCGGCMLNGREMQNRLEKAEKSGVSVTNYGTLIAYMNGILKRSLEVFPEILNKLK